MVTGEGAFSTVYKVKRLSDGQEYALKKVRINKNELSFFKSFMELTESYKGENGEIDWKRKTKCTQWSENPCIYPVSLFINSESALDVDPDCFLFRTSYLTKNNLYWYVGTRISSPTRNHSLKIRLQHCALWWNTQMEETYFKKSMQLKTTRRESKSLLLGHTSSKWYVGFKLFMIAKLSIETSNVLTCSSPKQVSLNWEI